MTPGAPPRWLLSIHEDSNANATLFRDGRPVAAVAEERLTRVRFKAGFPERAVTWCLERHGIGLQDLDQVVAANATHFLARLAPGLIPEGDHDYFGARHKAWLYLQTALGRGGALGKIAEGAGRAALKRRLPRLQPFVDHHTAHAYSAYLTSGFEEALAVTADNMGDGFSSKVFTCRGGRCHFEYGSPAHQSPGQFYGEVAQLLGFHNLMAGKVTGMAAHGDPRPAYGIMERLFRLHPSERRFELPGLLRRSRRRGLFKELAAMRPVDVAAAAQRRLEEVMVAYVRHALLETGMRSVVLAGGTFANVVVNQRILALPEVERIYIHPAMTDQGISMGAGLAWLGEHDLAPKEGLPSVFLGPSYSEESMGRALEAARLRARRPDDLPGAIVDLLEHGLVVARYTGAMEYGLRALGPDLTRCFEGTVGGELAARFMTITFAATGELKALAPGVVHLDGTARPQVVRPSEMPGMAEILERFAARTGIPALINTSFNMHSEPIVCTPEDAIAAFQRGKLDALVLGPYLVLAEETGG